MEPQGSLALLQVPATCPYSAPDQSRPWIPSHFLKIHFNIVLQSMPRSSKKSTELYMYIEFGGLFKALCKIARATVGFVMSVRLSVRPSIRIEKLTSHRVDFIGIWFNIFRKSVEKIQVSL
jgi:hypothetical protein